MATTTVQGQYLQKIATEEYLLLHPETDAEIVLLASEKLTSTNLKDAVEELYQLVQDITGGGVVTGVKGDAEEEYRLGNVNITKANIGLGNVDNTADADKPVSTAQQTAIDDAVAGKQDTLTFDTTPTSGSTNPVTSGGVYSALEGKQDTLTIDTSVTSTSTNPVASSGIASAIATAKSEVEAEIPDVSEFITKSVSDLVNYYTSSQVDTIKSNLESEISAIPKFSIAVVDDLPTEDISTTTIYLVKTSTSETGNLYTEYIYLEETGWESLGTQTVDLSGYVTTDALNTAIAGFLTETDVNSLISTALASYYTKTEVDAALAKKQDALTIDTDLSTTSENPVQNKAIATAVNTAQSAADAAQSTADSAASAAATAQSTADTAKTNAATAQSTADSAATAASNAQSTADDAASAASSAQTTADSAATAASKAQSTADDAASAASVAQSDVDTLNTNIKSTTATGTYSAVSVNATGVVIEGGQVIEVGAESQTEPSDTLVTGGIFFKRI